MTPLTHTYEIPSRPSFGTFDSWSSATASKIASAQTQPRNPVFSNVDAFTGDDDKDFESIKSNQVPDSKTKPTYIRQDKIPFFRERTEFTLEVPRPLTRDQYFNFFDEEDLWQKEKRKSRRRGKNMKKEEEEKVENARKLFETLLKKEQEYF